jgi:hypothetical protein
MCPRMKNNISRGFVVWQFKSVTRDFQKSKFRGYLSDEKRFSDINRVIGSDDRLPHITDDKLWDDMGNGPALDASPRPRISGLV